MFHAAKDENTVIRPMLDQLPIDEEEREYLYSSINEQRGMNHDTSDNIEKEDLLPINLGSRS